jgi:diguanylate cyclase (GGDEF)-like protein
MFQNILIIDNDTIFAKNTKSNLEKSINTKVQIVNFDDIKDDKETENYSLYIIRLDNKTDKIIKKLSLNKKIIIITTNKDDEENRKKILSYNVTDYMITDINLKVDLITNIVKRLINNSHKTVMSVDDSKLVNSKISLLLQTQNLNHIHFYDGKEAWEYLNHPSSKKIDLVIADYEMPNMDGYDLVENIRAKYSLEELPILVLSISKKSCIISKFLKAGANDFITKPFINEEFTARIANTLTLLDMYNKAKNMAMTDYLTGLHNRAYFYATGKKALDISKRTNHPISIGMIDIDNFKKINDTYGHDAGDKVLVHVANTIKKMLRRSDIFVRFGGEEFVIMLPNCPLDQAHNIMDKIRKVVAKSAVNLDNDILINITISVGVSSKMDTLDEMIKKADKYMYIAKKSGKNRVCSQD